MNSIFLKLLKLSLLVGFYFIFIGAGICNTAHPPIPKKLTAEGVSSVQINLNWEIKNESEGEFEIERRVENGSYSRINENYWWRNEYQDIGLQCETKYYYRVRGVIHSEGGSIYSDYSDEVAATTGACWKAVRVSTGMGNACAITSDMEVKCWGYNSSGELGNGTSIDYSRAPTNVVGLTSNIADVSLGFSHVCALTETGGVKCWGANNNGQLGMGTNTGPEMCGASEYPYSSGVSCSTVPVDVVGLDEGVTAIASGFDGNCALLLDGKVKCWGSSSIFGWSLSGENYKSVIPIDMPYLSDKVIAVSIGAFDDHICVITNEGGVKCWFSYFSWYPYHGIIDIPELKSGVIAVSVGFLHSCALTSEHKVKCWENNQSIQNNITKMELQGLTVSVSEISAKFGNICVLTSEGKVLCWDDLPESNPNPIETTFPDINITSISAGEYNSCALTFEGGIMCWGDHALGIDYENTGIPVYIPGFIH